MSLTRPPADPADDIEHAPSRRFRILFGGAILLIAIGYMWVWQVGTGRVVPDAPPVLAVAQARTATAIDDTLAERIRAALDSIPSLTVITADSARADRAGADQLLFALLEVAGPAHRLTVRRTDLDGDSLLHTYRVHGASVDDAVYRMAVQVAMSFGLPRPAPR